jgi:RecB family exonuclease
MSEVAVPEVLGELLSPSQATTYLACPAKWYFRYLVGLTEPATGALALGKAFHGTLARNFRQKMSTGRDMENGELSETFAEEWSLAMADAALRDDEDATELAITGETLVRVYVTEAARSVKPKAVEQTVQGEIAGVRVRGIVDLLDVDGCVFDFKTSSKRPNGISAEHCLQLTTYTMITPEASGQCRLDTVTKTKTVNVVQQSYRIGPDDRRFAETLYPMVQESIRDGIYPPHRSSPLCSRRYCGYWRECEHEFGGRVAE